MATDLKRSKAIHIYTPFAEDYRIEVVRETRRAYENGDNLPHPSGERRVSRQLSAIAAQAMPNGAVTISNYAELAALIAACAAQLAAEDEQLDAERAAALAANAGLP